MSSSMSLTKRSSSQSASFNASKRQGNLFSFFSKKLPSPSDASAGTQSPSADSPSDGNRQARRTVPETPPKAKSSDIREHKKPRNSSSRSPLYRVGIGSRIEVYWPDDDEFYAARVIGQTRGSTTFTLKYELDNEEETINLANERFRLLDDDYKNRDTSKLPVSDASRIDGDDEEVVGPSKKRPASSRTANADCNKKQRRTIVEDSDEEFEFDDADDGDGGSNFDENDAMEEDDDDGFIVSDEDEGPKASTKRKLLRVVPVSQCKSAATNGKRKENPMETPVRSGRTTSPGKDISSPAQDLSSFAVGSASKGTNAASSPPASKPNTMTPSPLVTPPTQKVPSSRTDSTATPTAVSKNALKPSLPDTKAVNVRGTHWHNHFTFLHDRRRQDSQNRPASDPSHDPRTLKVDYQEMERITGNKLTPASRQWWEMKAMYADTILLFKTGKFYEIYHMDADAAVASLGLTYMRGGSAHAGFPESAYGTFSSRLVSAGYKVARVEQTETPEMLKERKKKCSRSAKKPQVVNREVCSILTAGTRTFCYLDDARSLENLDNYGSSSGPLLAIREATVDGSDSNATDGSGPVCEYGVALVDAVRGVVTLGQFADDVLRSRMTTLLATFGPSEILIEGGEGGASSTLHSLLNSHASTSSSAHIERINPTESFPKSTAVDAEDRQKMERPQSLVQPWDVEETLSELHRRGYYPRSSRKSKTTSREDRTDGTSRWPDVLRACVTGNAALALSAFGAAVFYLQRSLIDDEILSMGLVKAYIPPSSPEVRSVDGGKNSEDAVELKELSVQEARRRDAIEDPVTSNERRFPHTEFNSMDIDVDTELAAEAQLDHMALDGTTLANLEILLNSHSNTVAGSLWSKINYAKSPHGSRLLRAWLLRPLFRKEDIDRRADAVEELASGDAAGCLAQARSLLAKCGDMERLLSRVHSMGGSVAREADGENSSRHHPNERAVLYDTANHTKRKVSDFSKLLNGLKALAQIPEVFTQVDISSGLLSKIVRSTDNGGCFPSNMMEELDWFTDNFDCEKASKGLFEPTRGIDERYDDACDTVERIRRQLEEYKRTCSSSLKGSAKKEWKYINTKDDSKDKYLIELPASLPVPNDFYVKGKRGSGAKQINKYRTSVVEELVQELEDALDLVAAGKERGMQLVFAKFDAMRAIWSAATQASAALDALGALSEVACKPGYCRPEIAACTESAQRPRIDIVQGRHPCVDVTHSGGEFIPNDLSLGPCASEDDTRGEARVLLLSGPNMGGKSTLLRQTCLICILAQLGSFVPAESATLSPVDRIYTRLGASDRILQGQSTFFVELAETAAALRGATRRSLVIMDELGRGTSTFDGTAIAGAAVKHLIERNRCLALFATHYHSLLEDWKQEPMVRLGHMECLVEDNSTASSTDKGSDNQDTASSDRTITFLYTLGEGACPRSFGINVARLAALPEQVLKKAEEVSGRFEQEMSGAGQKMVVLKEKLCSAIGSGDVDEAIRIWESLQ